MGDSCNTFCFNTAFLNIKCKCSIKFCEITSVHNNSIAFQEMSFDMSRFLISVCRQQLVISSCICSLQVSDFAHLSVSHNLSHHAG